MSDETSSWFQYLKALGQQQGFLTYAQVNRNLPLVVVDPEEISEVVEQFKGFGIRVIENLSATGN